jgi:TonB-dependent receptor
MVHLRYALSNLTNLRVAATQTMSRPNYWDIAPHVTIDHSRPRIRRGNPDLETTLSWNLDLMGEHYFQGIGIASAGLFYKDMSNIIFEAGFDLEDDDPTYPGYEVETTVNGESAWLWGIELVWQQEFTFLPGFWSGFGIYANYTHTESEADLLDRTGEIPGQAGDVGNLALAYEMGGFSARISYAYQGKYIEEVGGKPDDDEWVRAHGQLDLTAAYRIYSGFSVFLEFVNITNEAKYEYQGIEDRPYQVEYYSWWSRIGFKYTM